jgi:hypothetical protein
METIKVKPWGEGQGEYVLVNKEDFDPAIHVLLDSADGKLPEAQQRAILIAELQAKGVEFDESWPTDELRALSITKPEVLVEAKKRGRPAKA